MKHIFHSIILIYFLNTAYATENDWQLSLHGENLDSGHAASIAMQTGDYLYGGLSLNYIKSDTVIQQDNRKTIYPLFLFMGLKYPAKITPFIEGGIDLPEALFDELFDNEEDAIDLTDYYLSGGVNIDINDKYAISMYAKKYVFKYHEATLFITNKVRDDSYGMSLNIKF